MANAAVAWLNLFDSATITASSSASATMLATLLQQADVARKWRSTGAAAENVLASFSTNQSANVFGCFGIGDDDGTVATDFLATGTIRLRLSSADATGAAGDIYDSTAVAGIVDPNYKRAIHYFSAPKTGWKYARWDFAQAGASAIQYGRGFIGNSTSFTYNASPGASRTINDPTIRTKTNGGLTVLSVRRSFITQELNFSWVTDTQRWAVLEAMDLANGAHKDILLIWDTDSTNLGRDSIWGLQELQPVILPFTITDLFSRVVRIEQRL